MLATALVLVAGIVLLAAVEPEGDGDYVVRAIFDNADFIVEGEEVRVAGARVGTVRDIDVSRPGEIVSSEDGGEAVPGKAVVELLIDDPGFQDFREDASCRIRPQSLLGEKFVECIPTQPRAAGTEPPPLIEPIPEGERGEGQLLLPLESNGKAVDLDIVNNIMREPEVDRFRIILNELGAGLAARGEDLAAVIRRANPALQQTDRVLAILAAQNRQLAQLAKDSDTSLGPLARERRSLRGFIDGAGETAAASAERGPDIGAGIERLPRFFGELESTMTELTAFAEQGTPLARDLRTAAEPLAGATEELSRFSPPATTALKTLGDAAEESGPDIAASTPVIRQLKQFGEGAAPAGKNLTKLLRSLRKSGGYDELMTLLLNVGAGVNGFDEFGHFLRAQLLVTNCVDYVVTPLTGCGANWTGQTSPTSAFIDPLVPPAGIADRARRQGSGGGSGEQRDAATPEVATPEPPAFGEGRAPVPETEVEPQGEGDRAVAGKRARRGATALLDYLMGEGS